MYRREGEEGGVSKPTEMMYLERAVFKKHVLGGLQLKYLRGRDVGERGETTKGSLKVEALGFPKILVPV